EASAAAEAMPVGHRSNRKAGMSFFVAADCHPATIDVVRTRAEPIGIDVHVGDPRDARSMSGVFAVLLQYPGSSGAVRDDRELIAGVHAHGALGAVAHDRLALLL